MPIVKIWEAVVHSAVSIETGVFADEASAQDFILEKIGCDRRDYDDWADGFSNDPPEGETFADFVKARAEDEQSCLINVTELAVFPDVERYDTALNTLEIPPNGDDYNALFELLQGGRYEEPTPSGR